MYDSALMRQYFKAVSDLKAYKETWSQLDEKTKAVHGSRGNFRLELKDAMERLSELLSDEMKRENEKTRARTAQLEVDLKLLEERERGVHGSSPWELCMTPSELCKTARIKSVEPWFAPLNGTKYDSVHATLPTSKKSGLEFRSNGAISTKMYVQDGVSEKSVQDAWKPSFQKVFSVAEANGIHWWDGHSSTKWLNKGNSDALDDKAPDGIAHCRKVTGKPQAALVMAVHDNTESRPNGFTHDDKGKLLQYCLILLQFHQPSRDFLAGSLFDGRRAQCFQVCRSGLEYEVKETRLLDVNVDADADLYAGFMTSERAMGWDLERLSPRAGRYLGQGATSIVFEDTTNQECVIKIPFLDTVDAQQYEREKLSSIGDLGPFLVRLHDDDESTNPWLVLTPRFERLPLTAPFKTGRLRTLITGPHAPLKALHTAGFGYCDLRPDNIMQMPDGSNQLTLVDLGSARILEEECIYDRGTIYFASNRVIEAWDQKNETFKFEPADDLVSMVRCLPSLKLCAALITLSYRRSR